MSNTKNIIIHIDNLNTLDSESPSDNKFYESSSDESLFSDKTSSDKISSNKTSSDKTYSDKISSNKTSSDKTYSNKISSDKTYSDKISSKKETVISSSQLNNNYPIETFKNTDYQITINDNTSKSSLKPLTRIVDLSLNNIDLTPGTHLNKLTFKNVNDIIRSQYAYSENHSSTALDILAIYMKGQKILYTESKTYCEQKLIGLMLPSIFISIACTVLGSALDPFYWGKFFVAGLNAFNAFLLALISYLKLDAKAESHKISAYKYDKLQSLCEFSSGKLLFFSLDDIEITKKIDEIEAKVKEIKETNQFILPEHIRNRYPLLFATNVFAEVKKIQYDEMILINNLKNIINTIINLNNLQQTDHIKYKIITLEEEQNEKINEIIQHRKKFLDLDAEFEKEIAKARKLNNKNWLRFNCVNT